MASRTERVTVLKVVDGDTINVSGKTGPKNERVRLYGIDAPESDQQGGAESTKHLKRLIGNNRRIWIDRKETDRHGRTVGLLYQHKGKPHDSYNYRMVLDGHAHVYLVGTKDRERYREAQSEAKRKQRGMWKKRKEIVAPTVHRAKGRRQEQKWNRIKLGMAVAGLGFIGYLVTRNWSNIQEFVESVRNISG